MILSMLANMGGWSCIWHLSSLFGEQNSMSGVGNVSPRSFSRMAVNHSHLQKDPASMGGWCPRSVGFVLLVEGGRWPFVLDPSAFLRCCWPPLCTVLCSSCMQISPFNFCSPGQWKREILFRVNLRKT